MLSAVGVSPSGQARQPPPALLGCSGLGVPSSLQVGLAYLWELLMSPSA